MEALIEEDAVKPSNPNFEIDQVQIGNYVNEEMRSSTYFFSHIYTDTY